MPTEVGVPDPPESRAVVNLPFTLTVDLPEVEIFQTVTFKLRDSISNDDNDFFSFLKYNVLDSLIWSTNGASNKLHLIERRGGVSFGVKTLWGHSFYTPGRHVAYLKGYQNGKLVVNDSIGINVSLLKSKDFLHFSWSDVNVSSLGRRSYANSEIEVYQLSTMIDVQDELKGISLFAAYESYWADSEKLAGANLPERARLVLVDYVNALYGISRYSAKGSDVESIYQQNFKREWNDVIVHEIWETHNTSIVLLQNKGQNRLPEEYFIYAEPRYD